MALPSNKIKKVTIPSGNSTSTYDIVPEMLQKDGYSAELPSLSINSNIVITEEDQKINGVKSFSQRPTLDVERLPVEYQEVEYLNSDGTSYVNTGLPVHMAWKYKLIFQQNSASNYRIWGVFNQQTYNGGLNCSLTYGSSNWLVRWETVSGGTRSLDIGVIDTNKHTLIIDQGEVYFDGIDFEKTTAQNNSVVSSYNAFLFTINPGGTTPTATLNGKIFAYQVWDENGVLKQNFVPCYRKSDGVRGFYDLVGETFIAPVTGTLSSGNAVVSSEFLVEADLSPVALSGDYNDLSNTPNLSGYVTLTTAQTISGQKTFSSYPIVKGITLKNNVTNPTGSSMELSNDNGYNGKLSFNGKGIMLTAGSVCPTTSTTGSNIESLGTGGYLWKDLYLKNAIKNNNTNYGITLPDMTSWSDNKQVATMDDIPDSTSDLTNDGDGTSPFATQSYVASAIDALPEPMVFKGSLGTGGTITTLPTASADNEGWTYKVITNGTYASQSAKVGDTFICAKTSASPATFEWVLIPSGDEPSGTVTSVGLSAPTGFSVSNSPVTSSGTLTLSFASGYSLPTAAKQSEWDAKATGAVNTTSGSESVTINNNTVNVVTRDTDQTISGAKSFTQRPGLVASRLPDEYQEVEYIESNGTQYIDTNVIGTENTSYLIVAQSNTSDPMNLFGSRESATSKNITTFIAATAPNMIVDFGDYNITRFRADVGTNKFVVYNSKNKRYINNSSVSTEYSGTFNTVTTLKLLDCYNSTTTNKWSGKLFSCQIYESNTMIRNFVPCYRKSDGVIGLYDNVNDVFYVNAGTGTFSKGVNVVDSDFLVEADLAPVAFSGSYSDLTNKPTIPTNYVTTDTTQTITGAKTFNNDVTFGTYQTNYPKILFAGANVDRSIMLQAENYRLKIMSSNTLMGEINTSTDGIASYTYRFQTTTPLTNNAFDLGNSSLKWRNLYLAGNLTDGTNSIAIADIASSSAIGSNYVTIGTAQTITGKKTFTQRPGLQTTRLPNTYQEVAYIESSGTQYINTGYTALTTSGINISYAYAAEGNAGVCGIFQNTAPRTDTFFVTTSSGQTSTVINLISRGNSLVTNIIPSIGTIYNAKINYYNNGKLILNDADEATNGTNNVVSRNIILCGRDNNGNYAFSSVRIYSCKITEGSSLVRDFVPCYRVSDNEIGLYDLVNDQFYTNAGTGTFVKGANVVDSEFLVASDLATVATTGSYNDLVDKPSIPSIPTNYVTTDTTQTISGTKTFSTGPVLNNGIHLQGKNSSGTAYNLIGTSSGNNVLINHGDLGNTYIGGNALLTTSTKSGVANLGASDRKWNNVYLNGKIYTTATSSIWDGQIGNETMTSSIGFNTAGQVGFKASTTTSLPNAFTFRVGDTNYLRIGTTNIRPETDSGLDLGGSSNKWADLYLSGAIKDGTNTFSLPNTSGTLALMSDIPSPTTDTNQKIKVGATTFGNDDVIDIVAGDNITITPATTGTGAPKITIASTASGSVTDVQVNGTSVVSSGVANIVTNTAYDASSNKIATMSDIPTVSLTTTTGSEAVTVDSTSLTLVTRDTAQTITGQKVFDENIYVKNAKGFRAYKSNGTDTVQLIGLSSGNSVQLGYASNNPIICYQYLRPNQDNSRSLGDASNRWQDIYLAQNLTDGTNSITVANIESKGNKVTSISSSSTDTQYPSAKCVYDSIEDVREVAEGKKQTYVVSDVTMSIFNTQNNSITLTTSLTTIEGDSVAIADLEVGDTIYVTEVDVPDRWVARKYSVSDSNLFDNEVLLNASGWSVSNEVYSGSPATMFSTYGVNTNGFPDMTFASNTRYTIQYTVTQASDVSGTRLRVYYTDNTYTDGTSYSLGSGGTVTFTTTANKTVSKITMAYTQGNGNVSFYHVMVVQGVYDASTMPDFGDQVVDLYKLETAKVPVTSVNTKTGAVTLNASDVGAVATTASQGLDSTQQSNARSNIGAGTYSKPSGGIPSTDLAESYYLASNPNGYTSNTGTITGVSLNGTSIATSGVAALTGIATTSDLNSYLKLDGTSTMTGKLNLKDSGANEGNIGDNGIRWGSSTALPRQTAPEYFCVMDSFANGGRMKWSGIADMKTALGITTVNNATLTITQNGTSQGTFTANASSNATIEITTPQVKRYI